MILLLSVITPHVPSHLTSSSYSTLSSNTTQSSHSTHPSQSTQLSHSSHSYSPLNRHNPLS
jgi:hypothetical protein